MRLSTSLRAAEIEQTLLVARDLAARIGVTRVTNITWLDRIGLPVFASIRPSAQDGSLCVNAGKGLTKAEAEVGATMECIEFAMAEFGFRQREFFLATPTEICNSFRAPTRYVDFCPRYGRPISTTKPVACVVADEIFTQAPVWVPAELVFMPFRLPEVTGHFGCSTNGLASGNNRIEAIVHAIFELLERDTTSFDSMLGTSRLVELGHLPESVSGLVDAVRSSGFELLVRYAPSVIGASYFHAILATEDPTEPVGLAYGYGCHVDPSIALMRSITEAAQSRLSHIHGGRDDIVKRQAHFRNRGYRVEREAILQALDRAGNSRNMIAFDEIPRFEADTVFALYEFLLEALRDRGFDKLVCFDLSPPDSPVHVCRVVIPKMEFFEIELQRIGPRLAQRLENDW